MKTLEWNSRFAWVNRLLNAWPFAVHVESVRTIAFSFGPWGWAREGDRSLFYNGLFFVRLIWPLGIFASVRWSGRTDRKAFLQLGFGWKLNGRAAITFRVQSDRTGARGVNGPNIGQATGWGRGPK